MGTEASKLSDEKNQPRSSLSCLIVPRRVQAGAWGGRALACFNSWAETHLETPACLGKWLCLTLRVCDLDQVPLNSAGATEVSAGGSFLCFAIRTMVIVQETLDRGGQMSHT